MRCFQVCFHSSINLFKFENFKKLSKLKTREKFDKAQMVFFWNKNFTFIDFYFNIMLKKFVLSKVSFCCINLPQLHLKECLCWLLRYILEGMNIYGNFYFDYEKLSIFHKNIIFIWYYAKKIRFVDIFSCSVNTRMPGRVLRRQSRHCL